MTVLRTLKITVVLLAFATPSFAFAQANTGTLVDPSVPAGVAPNPSTLENVRFGNPTPTPRPDLKMKKQTMPKANPEIKTQGPAPGFVPGGQAGPAATPSAVHAPTATPNIK